MTNHFLSEKTINSRGQARTQGGGGCALGARAPSHLGKMFRSEMYKRGEKVPPRYVRKKNVHVPLRYDKMKTKKVGKNKKIVKRKG